MFFFTQDKFCLLSQHPPEFHESEASYGTLYRRSDCFYYQHNMPTHCPNRTTLGIVNRDGAFAEYLTFPTENLHLVPDNVSDQEAVFVEPLADNTVLEASARVNPPENARLTFDFVANDQLQDGYPSM